MAMAVRDLTPTTGGKFYEAWAVGAGGVPVPLGSFTVGTGGTGAFQGSRQPGRPGDRPGPDP